MYICAHNVRYRVVQENFQHSRDTISLVFYKVLDAMQSLYTAFVLPPETEEVPEKILENPKFSPYFDDCVGALDGSHVVVYAYRGGAGSLEE